MKLRRGLKGPYKASNPFFKNLKRLSKKGL
jgi:hypothetical protein